MWDFKKNYETEKKKRSSYEIFKVMTPSVLLYGSETRVVKRKDVNRMQTTEMGYLRSVKGFTRTDHTRNKKIRIITHRFSTASNRELQKKMGNSFTYDDDERIPKTSSEV
jgi:hypothetical protein